MDRSSGQVVQCVEGLRSIDRMHIREEHCAYNILLYRKRLTGLLWKEDILL